MNEKLTAEKLAEILESHKWLRNEEGGQRAGLSNAGLRSADLRSANLSCADLRSANLSSADLHYANLRGANLRGADLRGANLSSADLSNADLRGAGLSYAGLRSAENLQTTCVWDTNLSSTKLDGRWVVIAQIGSRKGTTYYDKENDILRCGCFKGDLAEFEEAVERTPGDHPQYLAEYRAAIAYIKAICEIEVSKND